MTNKSTNAIDLVPEQAGVSESTAAKPSRKRRMAREPNAVVATPSEPVDEATARPSKITIVTDLLRRKEGATLDEMIAATGWQAHSTRAVLTGLRKKGHTIVRAKRDDVTCYRISDAA